MSRLARLPRMLRLTVVPAMLAVGWLAADGLLDLTTQNRKWLVETPIQTASATGAKVFDELLAAGAIWVERSDSMLRVRAARCGAIVRKTPSEAQLADGARPDAAGVAAIVQLCESDHGQRIRRDILQFNSSFQLIAVRDDRHSDRRVPDGRRKCLDGAGSATALAERGCTVSEWRLRTAVGNYDLPFQDERQIPDRAYDFLALPPHPGFGDWIALPIPDPQAQFVLRTVLPSAGADMNVQMIGVPGKVRVNGGGWRAVPSPDATGAWSMKLDGLRIEGRTRCTLWELPTSSTRDGARCTSGDATGRGIAARMRLSGAAGDIEILAAPSVTTPNGLAGNKSGDTWIYRSGQLILECAAGVDRALRNPASKTGWNVDANDLDGVATGAKTGCTLAWAVSKAVEQGEPTLPQITASEGAVQLLDAAGGITPEALNLGLQDVIGYGVDDNGSLAKALANAGRSAGLTIDAHLQAAALMALEAGVRCTQDPCERRGELVLLSADPATTGDVLAAATFPRAAHGLTAWDLRGIERASPPQSPVAGHPWIAHDIHSRTGSVFKMATALAGIEALVNMPDGPQAQALATLLRGDASQERIAQLLGVRMAAANEGCAVTGAPTARGTKLMVRWQEKTRDGLQTRDKSYCIDNSDDTKSLGSDALAPQRSGCGAGNTPRIGMCEAMIKSSNLYFSGLALYLHGLDPYDPASAPATDLVATSVLVRIARRLVPAWADNTTRAPRFAHVLQQPGANHDGVARLKASLIQLDAAKGTVRYKPKFEIAQAGYGQGVEATPLSMALTAASIAGGEVVLPRLLADAPRSTGGPLIDTPPGKEALRDEMLDLLRAGMRGVVTVGTARGEEPGLEALEKTLGIRIWAKTGTATLLSSKAETPNGKYAAWLSGWAEGPNGKRIAFTCRVAFTPGYGGNVCGPIVADALKSAYGGP